MVAPCVPPQSQQQSQAPPHKGFFLSFPNLKSIIKGQHRLVKSANDWENGLQGCPIIACLPTKWNAATGVATAPKVQIVKAISRFCLAKKGKSCSSSHSAQLSSPSTYGEDSSQLSAPAPTYTPFRPLPTSAQLPRPATAPNLPKSKHKFVFFFNCLRAQPCAVDSIGTRRGWSGQRRWWRQCRKPTRHRRFCQPSSFFWWAGDRQPHRAWSSWEQALWLIVVIYFSLICVWVGGCN